jgi:hypothetical protein
LLLVAAPAIAAAQLVATGNHRIFQFEVGGTVEEGDSFGAALAAGDFNRDGFFDLAIGAPGEGVGAATAAGAVYVVYGSAAGLNQGPTAALVLHQDVAGVADAAESDDGFGTALAAADVNGDGWDDLAVGIPGEFAQWGADGAFQVFLSSVGGVVAAADSYFDGTHFDSPLVYQPYPGARLGAALAACDLDGDGMEELLVGAPDTPNPPPPPPPLFPAVGHVLELPGGAGGTTVEGAEAWDSGSLAENRFGAAIACRRAPSTGLVHVLVGAPAHAQEGSPNSGALVTILGGEIVDFTAVDQTDAFFGSAAALGDFAGVGEPQALGSAHGWSFAGPISQAGRVYARALGSANTTSLHQDSTGIADDNEGFDHFGAAVAVADFDRDGFDDAVVGVPDENFDDGTPDLRLDVGAVHVLFGGAGGLSASGSQYWHWDAIPFGALAGDRFGAALATGDFDGNGVDDLAIGAPGALWSGQAETGIVQILYAWPPGWIFGDDFEGGNAQKWAL